MKKLFLVMLSILMIGCSTVKTTDFFGANMKNTFEREFTQVQFDSICNADGLPNNFSKWHRSTYHDFENGNEIVEYLFIKSLGENQNIYRVEKRGEIYKITKRITK